VTSLVIGIEMISNPCDPDDTCLLDNVILDYDRPQVVRSPVGLCTLPGSTVILEAVADGNGPLAYHWRRAGQFVSDGPTGSGSTLSGTLTPSITITNYGSADVAAYDCVISNGCGTAVTAPATPSLAPCSCSKSQALPDGLAGYWSFDDGTARDESGHGNDGVVHGTTVVPGISGAGLFLNGNGDHVDIKDSNSLSPSLAISLCAWYKPVTFEGHGNDPIINKAYWSITPPYYQYQLGVTGNAYPNSAASFNYSVSNSPTSYGGGYVGPGAWGPGQWYHLAVTYDQLMIRLYVNGVLRSSSPLTGAVPNFHMPVCFGVHGWRDLYLPGTIDEIRIYNRAISANEVSYLYEHPDGSPGISDQPLPQVVCDGGTVALDAQAFVAEPLIVHWRKGGTPLSDGPTGTGSILNGSETFNLQIAGVGPADIGSYDCVVTNSCGSATSNAASLSVLPSGTGDGNGDSAVNGLDIQGFINATGSGGASSAGYCAYDMDQNGVVNLLDLPPFVSYLLTAQ